uniref:EGF-like domain-containing protein n=1 Tax=Hippocampus comes TaxID=109280 RepID=A0A3Q3DFM1_HIPCM
GSIIDKLTQPPGRCDIPQRLDMYTVCTSCAAVTSSLCPRGFTNSGVKNCSYLVQIGGNKVLLDGCHRLCVKSFMQPRCCPQHWGPLCFFGPDCKPCIGGFQHPCYDKGTCFDGIRGNGSCSCQSPFEGVACHICSDPSKHGEHCDEECHCVHGVCDNRPGSGGVCRRGSCLEGFSGERCDKAATPCNADGLMEHCHINTDTFCPPPSKMFFWGKNALCVCRDGYEGDGHSCTAINRCLKSNRGGCHANAECVYVSPGNVSCVCVEGWTGDGRVCVEINNCQTDARGGCSTNANCNHIGPGQSECVCKTGYMGNGVDCDFINPCFIKNGGCHELVRMRIGATPHCLC